MIKYLITGDELSALYGRSWLAQLIYLRALRPYMDYATGIIGRARKISYQSIAEELERDTRRGRHTDCSGPPTLKEVRCALEELELVLDPELPPDDRRPALLRRISADRQLVFEALMAPRDSSASGMRGRRRADVGQTMKGTEETSSDAVPSDMKGRRRADPDVPMTGTHPESGIRNTPSLRSGGEACPQNQQIIPLPSSASGDKSPSQPPKKKGLSPEMEEACRATWKAYSDAYFARYGVEPVRNPKVNRNIVDFVKRIGMTDAPHVAAWYLTHTSAYYVRQGHSVGALLADAEKLRTEWATGIRMTDTKARQSDRAGTTASHVQEILAERRAKR